ncbi:MAG: S16 family serine protease [Candidatus Izemoplasmatales bacterium]|nr:S16 family serine protease [Candidatus Izemoplasmatales bacterium]
MKELTDKYWPIVKILFIPYLFMMFLLVYQIDYFINAPGGITEVEKIISIDYNEDKTEEGSISSTFVVSLSRPTFFQFLISSFSDYNYANILTGNSATYTNDEQNKISFLDKYTSVNEAIIVAYQKAAEINPEIVIDVYQKVFVRGKAPYLSFYDDIEFGDEFLYMMGDGDVKVEDFQEIGNYTIDSDSYDFFFKNSEGETYSRTLTKDEEEKKFGIVLYQYNLVNKENTYPTYHENNSNIGGPSGGLLQTLAIYNMLVEEDITKGLKVAGTGTIDIFGNVGYIGAIEQKIITAYVNDVDIFFVPHKSDASNDDYILALKACEKHGIDSTDWIVPVSTFQDALDYLEGIDE